MQLQDFPNHIQDLIDMTETCLERKHLPGALSYQWMKASSDIQLYAPQHFSKMMPLQLNTLSIQLHQLTELQDSMSQNRIGPGKSGHLLSLFAQSQQQEKIAEQVKDTLRYISESLPAFSQTIDSLNQDNSPSP